MTNHYSTLDHLFTALGDPTRRAVLSRLALGEATVSELAEPHRMALPSFMGHLRKLEQAGLVISKKKGRIRHCRLQPEALAPVRSWLEEQRDLWEGRLDRFDDYVTQLAKTRNSKEPRE
ncbi:MAG: metalloregulator ArsR/SmtB family transcription factor [Rhodospirillales bacterium]